MDRRMMMAGLAFAGAASTYPAGAQEIVQIPTQLANRQLAEQFAATLSKHDIEAFAALFADDYVNHQVSAAAPPPPAGITPKQGTVGFFAARLKGLPDLSVAIEALVAGDDMVAASFVYSGTHQGVYLGVPPTGKPLRFTSCDIFTVRNGKFSAHWGMGDIAGTLAQMKA
jgi:steroid delta-isomerase-like uncharacterized protein